MKKILKMLLMLTCVFTLTACGSEETMSEYQKNKVDSVQVESKYVIDYVNSVIAKGGDIELLENYSNAELGEVFRSNIYSEYEKYGMEFIVNCEGKAVRSALTTFKSGLEAMGSITQGTPSAVIDGDNIIVTVPVSGEKASGSVELIFTNDIYRKIISCTLNLNETTSELMTRAALNTLLGMGTVFTVLILISLIISAFGVIPKLQASFAKKNAAVETPAAEPAPAPAPAPAVVEEEEDLSDDMELVAVIAAAIAAYEGTNIEGFRVRSIKRSCTNSKWKKANI